jgi:hypothetical protein
MDSYYINLLNSDILVLIFDKLDIFLLEICLHIFTLQDSRYDHFWTTIITQKFDKNVIQIINNTDILKRYHYSHIYYSLFTYYNLLKCDSISDLINQTLSVNEIIYDNSNRCNSKIYDRKNIKNITSNDKGFEIISTKNIILHFLFYKNFHDFYIKLKLGYKKFHNIRWGSLYLNIYGYIYYNYINKKNEKLIDLFILMIKNVKNNIKLWSNYPELIFLTNYI